MIKITIHQEANNLDDMAEVLLHIAELLKEGYVMGHYPGWETSETEPDEQHD